MLDKKKRPVVVIPDMHALEAIQCTRVMLDRLETHIRNVSCAWAESRGGKGDWRQWVDCT
jgi:hypothetical protein